MVGGRGAELARLAELLADDTPVVLVGEAGVGKTTVLRAAASAAGRPVFEGGALSTLDWLDYLAFERALQRPLVGADATAVAQDVEAAVGAGVLLLDDLHWAAHTTLDVAARLAGRVAVLAGVRSGEPSTDRAVAQLRSAGYEVVTLPGLTEEQSAQLVAALRPDLSPGGRAQLLARAGGNPLLLRELAATGEPSASLRLAIEARLRKLGPVGQDAFNLLALAGRPVSAAAVGEIGVKKLVDADLAVLVADRSAGGAPMVEARHALLAEIAADRLAADEARALHKRIADEVRDDGEAARHLLLAGQSELAYAAALRAADATTRPAERARHLAVAAACAVGPDADELRLRAARALELVNHWDEMTRTLDLIDPANTDARAAACLLRARGAYTAGDVEGLRAALSAGLELAGGADSDTAGGADSDTAGGADSDTRVRLLIEQTRVPVFVDFDAEAGMAAAERGLQLAAEHGVDLARAHYLHGTAAAIFDRPGAVEGLERAIRLAAEAADTVTELLAATNLISTHEMSGDPAAGRALARRYRDRAAELGLGEWERMMRVTLVGLDFHAGDYSSVLDEAEDLLAETLDARAQGQLLELFCVALVDVGRADEALRRLAAAQSRLADDSRGRMEALWVRLEAAFWTGRPAEALRYADEYTSAHESDVNTLFGCVSRSWARLDLGIDPGEPASPQERPILRAIPLEMAGVRELHRGDGAHAAELLREAARLWAPYHRRGELRCLWGAAEAARRAGSEDAVRLLEAVEARARQHGMAPLLGRVHRSLRAAGERRSAPRVRDAGDALTGRQRELLQLVGAGLTNAQIASRLGISRHTVVTQLSSASAKLGAVSRAQAAALA
ncbi:LuxR C-terminal-related transcriptional regulator [uncultured Jatrophihabitans sp.]|uniref:helix-turn-helix transcriptional regulator n=1 Tax=uncultured Jatrophihabitans sp. TaxID=1610747 RepID=UPI0035CA94F5